MIQPKKFEWFCKRDGKPYVVTSQGMHLADAFERLPKYRQMMATHKLNCIKINGVRI